MSKYNLEIPKGEKCTICSAEAKHYCPYCVDEYDSAPRFVPSSYYCDEHYQKVVETGNCCYGAEQVWGVMA